MTVEQDAPRSARVGAGDHHRMTGGGMDDGSEAEGSQFSRHPLGRLPAGRSMGGIGGNGCDPQEIEQTVQRLVEPGIHCLQDGIKSRSTRFRAFTFHHVKLRHRCWFRGRGGPGFAWMLAVAEPSGKVPDRSAEQSVGGVCQPAVTRSAGAGITAVAGRPRRRARWSTEPIRR